MSGIIYLITNKENGKTYVGQTRQSLEKRWSQHIKDSRKRNYPIRRAISKYGYDSFSVEVLCECSSQEELDEKERYFTDLLFAWTPTGYSLRAGKGRGSVSEETRLRISFSRRGMKISEEAKQKQSLRMRGENHPLFGKTHSEETKKKQSIAKTGEKNPNFGKVATKETLDKRSQSLAKTWYFISPVGEIIVVYSLSRFCKSHPDHLCVSHMGKVASGKLKSHKGWTKWTSPEIEGEGDGTK